MKRSAALGLTLALLALPAAAQFSLPKSANDLSGLAGKLGGSGGSAKVSDTDATAGLREALKVASERTIGQVGKADGYLKDPAIHIPLPGMLAKGKSLLQAVGGAGLVDDLETRMNRAAEAAAPKARDIFVKAITDMSLQDAQGILQGPQDAATQYFRRTTSQPLSTAMRPVIDNAMRDVGALQSYRAVTDKLSALPGGGVGGLDITDHVLEKALDGLFHYIAKEEAAIRTNPAARSTELLRKVFG
jgi:hypothetical protein